MSISKKILDEINKLNLPEEDKDAIISILKVEDNGSNRYSADYDSIIRKYRELKGGSDE